MHDHVDHPVIEQIFGALEAFGKFLADRILDHALAREADQRFGLADLDIAEHRIAGSDAARRRIGEQHHVRKAGAAQTGEPDALLNARGTIAGRPAVVGVQDFKFMGGSMGLGVGAAFVAGVENAIKRGVPYIAITAAGGARMQEGTLSLMQMPRATVALARLRRAGLPYIVLLTDPTTGGVTASYAMLGDVQISEPKALIGFAGQRVIEITIREKLPEGFQRAEYLLDHGMIDMVVHRKELPATLARLIGYLAPEKAA